MSEKEMADLFAEIIKTKDLYGRSFTLGVALYYAIIDGYIDGWEIMDELKEWGGLEYRTPRGAVEDMDLAILDELARYLSGENDED